VLGAHEPLPAMTKAYMELFEIPAWLVALAALFMTVVVFTHDERIQTPIKIFSLASFMQFLIYLLFSVTNFPLETRQFIARSNIITTCIALSLILLISRRK
jgi:hypothetical protein